MKKGNRKKGYTLAELLIVVAIIAVLVAIVIPVIRKQVEKSREAYDIYTMRQAASLATEFYYKGATTKEGAEAAGLRWWDNGGKNSNASGVYNPGSGTFSPISSKEAKKSYGKGTKVNTGAVYTYSGDRKIYAPGEDYTNAVVLVSIYPEGHIDVYWKDIKTGKYIGGQPKENEPQYSLRIDF